jgi:hypothetical protein
MTLGPAPLPPGAANPSPPPKPRRLPRPQVRGFPLMPLILLLLALLDLRVDLQLLADHFTITSLLEAIRSHPLATAVLIFTPSLWRRYRT